jgi:alginate O-acetyltransferase complex protein AlgI
MRPLRSFLLLLIFLAVLTGLHYIVPVGNLFPPLTGFIPSEIVSLLYSSNKTGGSSPAITKPDSSAKNLSDTIPILKARPAPSGVIHRDPLSPFIDSLNNSTGQVRVLYYGDSQIEGDRITSYLRNTLRKERGGTGPGLLLPVMPVMYTKTVWIRSSSNWKKYNYLSYSTGVISHRKLGPFMAVCRYLPDGKIADVPEKAYMRIQPSYLADSSAAAYDYMRIFYGNCTNPVGVVVKGDDRTLFSATLQSDRKFHELTCSLGRAKDLIVEFEGITSPDIYGISIESKEGIIVDNIPQRGSAGLEFTMVDSSNLAESYRLLKPDLFVLHYGLNIVKNVRHDYSYFQKGLERQLFLLKELSPGTPILIVSLTDMAETSGDTIRSYPNIPAIIRAQRKASLIAGEAFWDSYQSMGGDSSIIRWADKKPPLAQKDYVHFTYEGADSLSHILATALFREKNHYAVNQTMVAVKTDTVIRITPAATSGTTPKVQDKNLARVIISAVLKYDPDKPLIFSTASFWIFFLLVLAGYSLVYKQTVVRNGYLFLVSLFFYYKSGGLFLFLLLIVTTIDFSCGLLIYNSESKLFRRLIIMLSIISNIGLLAYFKYAGFIVSTLNDLLGTKFMVHDFLAELSNSVLGTSFSISNILLPVGISFFTFQSLSYTIDVYRRRMTPVRNLVDFGFYVSFFPHLVAGPIVRASVFIPQIYNEFKLSRHEFSHALFMISKGLIKKVIISNFIAINLVDRIFDAPSVYSGFENLMAIYGYGLQIYCDFSGYTDIAIGVALIIGFRLPVNFYSPYKATSISDFWKRWHISLSQWLRDYLYISLGGNRKGKIRTYLNLMITMLLGGLWHGASLKYVIWGGLHGIGLVFDKIWQSVFRGYSRLGMIGKIVSVFLTFQFVNFCWIFFRAPDLASVNTMLRQITGNFSPGSYLAILPTYGNALMLMVVGYLIHFLPESVKESYRGFFIKIPLAVQLTVVLVVAVLLYQMRTAEVMPFIYFRF